jgi:hypothetical protein
VRPLEPNYDRPPTPPNTLFNNFPIALKRTPTAALGTSRPACCWRGMSKYCLHLAGDVAAHDMMGHECANDQEAKQYGSVIAHRIGTEKPEMVREGNLISVPNEQDVEIAWFPLASTSA